MITQYCQQVCKFGWRCSLPSTKPYFVIRKLIQTVANLSRNDVIERTRNIGIVAHIDAGKTTVTERMLYLAGAIRTTGDVDSDSLRGYSTEGNTITDFMDLERERGITIQSASVFFHWLDHKINLIDTPGHVDFSLEVERCARVLDGAVTVLDASAGVQAQTLNVWHQAKKFNLPCIFFINKMDKEGANFYKSIDSIKKRLLMDSVIPVCIPASKNIGHFQGIFDLIGKKYLDCSLGDTAEWTDVTEYTDRKLFLLVFFCMYAELMLGREEMFSKLADADDDFANWLLSQSETDGKNFDVELQKCLRRNTLSLNLFPVACGSALRCASSVKPLLDMVTRYFPAPNQRNCFLSTVFGDDFSGLVFKISHHKRHGQLSFVRIYTGSLKNGSSLYNASREIQERRVHTFVPYSDELQAVDIVKAGDIAILTGLQSTITGDTLLQNEQSLKNAKKRRLECLRNEGIDDHDDQKFSSIGDAALLTGIEIPDPVFFCAVEPPDVHSINLLEKALQKLTVEDPSMRIRTDKDTGQTILETMGELHIEVIKERLRREYGLNVFLGPLQVAYQEILDGSTVHSTTADAVIGEKKVKHECTLTLEVLSKPKAGLFKKVEIRLEEKEFFGLKPEWIKALNEGCANALLTGPILGFPVRDVEIGLKLFHVSGGRVNSAVISAAASKCVREALERVSLHLIEPIMKVEVNILKRGENVSMHEIIREFTQRRGNIVKLDEGESSTSLVRLIAQVPVAETQGLSHTIRSITSGLGNLHMQLLGYSDVPPECESLIGQQFKKSST